MPQPARTSIGDADDADDAGSNVSSSSAASTKVLLFQVGGSRIGARNKRMHMIALKFARRICCSRARMRRNAPARPRNEQWLRANDWANWHFELCQPSGGARRAAKEGLKKGRRRVAEAVGAVDSSDASAAAAAAAGVAAPVGRYKSQAAFYFLRISQLRLPRFQFQFERAIRASQPASRTPSRGPTTRIEHKIRLMNINVRPPPPPRHFWCLRGQRGGSSSGWRPIDGRAALIFVESVNVVRPAAGRCVASAGAADRPAPDCEPGESRRGNQV